MIIATIMNDTGQALELWDVGKCLAILDAKQAVHNLPPTITSVTRAGVSYHNRQGSFQADDSYTATFIPAVPPQMAGIQFTGNHGTVIFT